MFRKLRHTHTQRRPKQFHHSITNLSLPTKKWKKHRRQNKLTWEVDDVVVELVREQRFRQLPEERLEDHSCQVDVLHFSEVHTLSCTRGRERKKKLIFGTIEKDLDIWNDFGLHFYDRPFADHNKQNKEQKGHSNFTGTGKKKKMRKKKRADDGAFWTVPIPT